VNRIRISARNSARLGDFTGCLRIGSGESSVNSTPGMAPAMPMKPRRLQERPQHGKTA